MMDSILNPIPSKMWKRMVLPLTAIFVSMEQYRLLLQMSMAANPTTSGWSSMLPSTLNSTDFIGKISFSSGYLEEKSNEFALMNKSESFGSRNKSKSAVPANDEVTFSLSPPLSTQQQPRPHPFAGARFSNGTWGYVADTQAAKRRFRQLLDERKDLFLQIYHNRTMPVVQNVSTSNTSTNLAFTPQDVLPGDFMPLYEDEYDSVCNVAPTKGVEGKGGWWLLARKVQVNGPDPGIPFSNTSSTVNRTTTTRIGPPPRILCVMYTYPGKHYLVEAAVETWGHRCDGFLAVSTETHPDRGIVDIPHEGPEKYDNMWQKTRSIWAYIHDNYIKDFDFFHLSGDDVHLIVENLRNFLWSFEEDVKVTKGGSSIKNGGFTTDPLYLGQWIPIRGGKHFAGGGPGYTLNREALRRMIRDVLPSCRTDMMAAAEDRFLGMCLQEKAGILANDTRDSLGEQRYHGMGADFVFRMSPTTTGYFAKMLRYWQEATKENNHFQLEAASSQSVAFHLLKTPTDMKRSHAILYRSCPQGTLLGDSVPPPFSLPTPDDLAKIREMVEARSNREQQKSKTRTQQVSGANHLEASKDKQEQQLRQDNEDRENHLRRQRQRERQRARRRRKKRQQLQEQQ